MTIKVGDKLPEAKFNIMTDEGPSQVSTGDYFGGVKVALFAVPGAFTPTCHARHLPGFVANADKLKAKGIDKIACLSVNDVFVMGAWAKASGETGEIDFLADGSAGFTEAVGLVLDGSALGMGVRSLRYSMLVDDGVVTALNIEETPGSAEISSAEALLKQI